MSEVHASQEVTHVEKKSLWPMAAAILTMVFAPALVAWAVTLLRP